MRGGPVPQRSLLVWSDRTVRSTESRSTEHLVRQRRLLRMACRSGTVITPIRAVTRQSLAIPAAEPVMRMRSRCQAREQVIHELARHVGQQATRTLFGSDPCLRRRVRVWGVVPPPRVLSGPLDERSRSRSPTPQMKPH